MKGKHKQREVYEIEALRPQDTKHNNFQPTSTWPINYFCEMDKLFLPDHCKFEFYHCHTHKKWMMKIWNSTSKTRFTNNVYKIKKLFLPDQCKFLSYSCHAWKNAWWKYGKTSFTRFLSTTNGFCDMDRSIYSLS